MQSTRAQRVRRVARSRRRCARRTATPTSGAAASRRARLVESGVRFVEVTLDGWDTHKDNFGRTKKLMGTLDPAMSALLADLDERQLARQTLVVVDGRLRPHAAHQRQRRARSSPARVERGARRRRRPRRHRLGKTDDTGDTVVEHATSVPDSDGDRGQPLRHRSGEDATARAAAPSPSPTAARSFAPSSRDAEPGPRARCGGSLRRAAEERDLARAARVRVLFGHGACSSEATRVGV